MKKTNDCNIDFKRVMLMPKLTEEQKEKRKDIAQKVGDALWNSSAFAMVFILAVILICGTAFIFLLFYSAEESKEQYLADEQARAYYPSEGETCGDCEYGVDLADLGVELLDYEAYYRNEWGTEGCAPYTTCEYIFSTKDALESPTTVYTLHYEVRKAKNADELDELEEKIKGGGRYHDGTVPVAATLDYGAANAYWMEDELYLRYDDNCLMVFYRDTTRELLESQVCADFMRTEMKL